MQNPEQFDWVGNEQFHPVDAHRWWAYVGGTNFQGDEIEEWRHRQRELRDALFRWAREHAQT